MNAVSPSSTFYTKFAKTYEQYASLRAAYITAVNTFVVNEIGPIRTIIDIGSGSGTRAVQLAEKCGARHLTLVDNSDGMIAHINKIKNVRVVKDDISSPECSLAGEYDLVLCLWNVLGHTPEQTRKMALVNLLSLAGNSGVIILDVNNRYNISQYGIKAVAGNILKDIFFPRDSNGNFILRVDTESGNIQTVVHLFNPFEIEQLFRAVGLKIVKRRVIDYTDGSFCKTIFGGQLVYKLARQ